MGNILCCQNARENEEDSDNNIKIDKKELQNVMENMNDQKKKIVSVKENKPNLCGKKPMSIIFETDEKKEKESIDDDDEFLTDDLNNSKLQLKNTKLNDEKSKFNKSNQNQNHINEKKKGNNYIKDLDNVENKDKVLMIDKKFKEENDNLEKGDLKKDINKNK